MKQLTLAAVGFERYAKTTRMRRSPSSSRKRGSVGYPDRFPELRAGQQIAAGLIQGVQLAELR